MKKLGIVFIIILFVVLLLVFIFYNFYIKDSNNNVSNNTDINNTITSASTEEKSLEDLPIEYSLDDAISDGYFVAGYNTNYNEEKLERFISNIENKIPDKIRIAFSTAEGDTILIDIILSDDGTILFRQDSRRDNFSSEEDRIISEQTLSVNDYRIVEDFLGESKTLYFENRNEDFSSRIFICSCFYNISYNSNFELIFKSRKDLGTKIVIEKGTYLDYNIYTFGGDVFVRINDEELTLEDAIKQNKLNPQDIIDNCTIDVKENRNNVDSDEASDGGTRIYRYPSASPEGYSIIKYHSLDGNRDLYIGVPYMDFNDIKN